MSDDPARATDTICPHGSLRRKCETCDWHQIADERSAQIVQVMARVQALEAYRSKVIQQALEISQAIGVTPEQDGVGRLSDAVREKVAALERERDELRAEASRVIAMNTEEYATKIGELEREVAALKKAQERLAADWRSRTSVGNDLGKVRVQTYRECADELAELT